MLLVRWEGFGSEGPRRRGFRMGTKNSERLRDPKPGSPVRASARDISLSVALENHLTPLRV